MFGFAALSVFVIGAVLLLVPHLFQYIGLRVRNASLPDAEKDPQLGRKFALHMFSNLSVLLILVGVSISIIDLLDYAFEGRNRGFGPRGGFGPGGGGFGPAPARGEWFNEQQRTAAALLMSGFLHFVLFTVILLAATNNGSQRLVARSFVLARLLLAGIITMASTTVFLVTMLRKGETDYDTLKLAIGLGLVWGPTALAHLLMAMAFRDRKRSDRDDRYDRDRDRDERGRY